MVSFPHPASILPETIILETDAGRAALPGGEEVRFRDAAVTVDGGRVTLTAEATGVSFVTLRWAAEWPAGCRFLGDAWERGYGEFEWRGFVFDRVMPWYFFALSGGTLAGYGVKTGPNAM